MTSNLLKVVFHKFYRSILEYFVLIVLQKMFKPAVFKNVYKGINQKVDLVKQEFDYMMLQ